MSWDIEVHEKVYQRLANEIFFRILRQATILHRLCKRGGEQPGNSQKSNPGTATAGSG